MEIVTENATSLAWIGDAVMSLAVREHLLSLGYRKAHVLQKKNAVICSAKGQSVMLNTMMDEDFFTEDEKTILARGRNATIHSKAKNADTQNILRSNRIRIYVGIFIFIWTSG